MEQRKDTSLKMGTMPIPRLVATMSAPAILSMLVQALYNVVDSIYVSGYSQTAFTAVSLAFPIQIIVIAISVGSGAGINSAVSRRLGARDISSASNAAEHGIMLLAGLSVALMLLGLFAARYFFGLFTDDAQLVEYGTTYIRIILIFSFGRMLSQAFMSILQGSGDMIIPMIAHLMGAVTNIILDPILIFGTVFDIHFCEPMGIKGAAIATVIGQIITMLFLIIMFFSREHVVKLNLKAFKPNKQIMGGILAVGVPAMLSQAIMSLMVSGINWILSGISIAAVTVMGAYFKLNSLVFMPIFGFATGVMPIAGYNYGADNKERFKQTVKVGAMFAIPVATVGMILFLTVPDVLLGMFSLSDEVVRMGTRALRIFGSTFPIVAFMVILSATLQAIGKAYVSMMANIMRGIVILLPLSYLLLHFFGVENAWFASPISELVSITYVGLNYRKVMKNWIPKE